MRHVIGHLEVVLGCDACQALAPLEVPVLWGGCLEHARPYLDLGSVREVQLWRDAHRQPWAAAP